ncbi:SusC/RagA family TonB-linked outer membrane protein [Pontibacter actiniarum]|uniref:SusC/RagA family TonB-linked outer membrane protein n=1 Tax=Pontibacter actiniarum TaxID=323450 RepID=A0A1X9YT13_9BACT|nr:TonB-dependent receptor [Pontibacter actiniarum]ARS36029.1 SusC/RagA family TonB-linked outer membrane protein [Pontibacter actiniarum]
MKKILLLVFTVGLFMAQHALAQSRTVSGKVTDQEDGQALPGVAVVLKGTPTGTSTGVDGTYSIDVPANHADATLIFKFVGMVEQEIVVGAKKVIDVALQTDAKQLAEVVVTGYTTQNKREVSGSIATVNAEEVSQVPLASFDQALQGKAPGVLIQAQSGQPGAPAAVTIRGKGSIVGTNSPLYIVDGVQIMADDFSTLNPADFSTFNVLKDAAATSLYGSRGANGVIVITTKRGVAGKTRINYNVQYGYSKAPENRLEVMDTNQKLDYELANGNPYGWTEEDLSKLRKVNTDWEDVFFRTGKTVNHTLSASGGNDHTVYYLSGSVFDQTGTVENTGLQRYTGRANIDSRAGDFSFGLNATLGYSEFTNTIENNSVVTTPLNAIRWTNPYETPYDEQGNYTEIMSGQPNALQELLENQYLRQQLKGVGNAYVSYAVPFWEGLTLKTSWGGDFTANEVNNFIDPSTATGRAQTGRSGSLTRTYAKAFRYTGTTSAAYTKTFGIDHRLGVALFNEVVRYKGNNFGFTGYGLGGAFDNEAGVTPGTADNGYIPAVNGSGSVNALVSYFADVQYGFKERYFLNLGARRDGSSRFGSDRRYANFGSVGLSWIVTDEGFMAGLRDNVLNELKLKASYGSAGNQALETDFASRELFARAVYNGVSGLLQTQLANPMLQWERRTTLNAGFELATLQGRLRVTGEFYNALTSDLFLNRQLSRTSGYSSLVTNVGELRNRGVEMSLEGDLLQLKDFTWSATISLTYNKNEITKLVGNDSEIENGIYINRVGEPMNSLYLVRYAGVNPTTGDPQFYTKEGEVTSVYNPNDRVVVGSVEAPLFGGFGTSVNYKGFELSAFFSFVRGNKVYNNDRANIENPQYLYDNLATSMLTEWRKPGDITQIPRWDATWYNDATTRMVESGDFLRLRNVNVSYALPKSLTGRMHVESIKVFAQGQNLKTWTGFAGFDPEVSTGILSGAQYPALRTVTFGLNIGF